MIKERLIDLDRDQLDLLRTILKRHIPDKTVWAYGSRVTWKAGETSDLDLAVFGCDPMEIHDLKEALEESDLLVSVDVMDWESIPDEFKENIRGKYVVLQERASGPEGWQEIRLGDFVDIKHGYAFKGQYINDQENNNILVTPGNFKIGGGFKSSKLKYFTGQVPKDYILKEDDITVTMTDLSKNGDTLGYSAKVPKTKTGKKFLHNQRIGLLQFKSDVVDQDFIYWLLRTSDYHWFIVGAASGTSIKHTSPTAIKEYKFSLPPLPEQKAIAEVLSSLDDKIDLLHRQNKTLEAMAQALFRKWFVIEPKGHWKAAPLDSIADYLNGLACQKFPPENETEKLAVLKIKELRGGFAEDPDWVKSTVDEKYIVHAGDVIFSWSGSLMLKIWPGQKCVLNQHLFKVTSDSYPKWFFFFWIKHHLNKFIKIADSKATTMGHIKRSDLSNSMVLIPDRQDIEKMNSRIESEFEKIITNNAQIQNLENLRDVLLPKLMNGSVRAKVDGLIARVK